MSSSALRIWTWVHKWTSLVCTVFMLLLCITGLPLIFSHEIEHWQHAEIQPDTVAPGTAEATLDRILASAQARHPSLVAQYLSRDPAEPQMWLATLGPTADAESGTRNIVVDARTARVLGEPRFDEGFMHWMLRLHVDLFAGLPGTLFLGAMGLLLFVSIVSGIVVYGPFMRRLPFGTVRGEKSTRVRWLDLHNLLGIVTLAWALIVSATGVINTLGQPAIRLWQADQLQSMIAAHPGRTAAAARAPLQAAAQTAQSAAPDMRLSFIALPGTPLTSAYDYGFYFSGTSAFSARLFKPVLVDAGNGALIDTRELAWYIKAILVSQPFHFGDYGGLPMKILWALADLVTIVVLGSGLYLWWTRRQRAVSATGEVAPPHAQPGNGVA
jgi:uncharacterized iron-regulated membrane protein